MADKNTPEELLKTPVRWLSSIIGGAAIILAFFVYYRPPYGLVVEKGARWELLKSVASKLDATVPFTVLAICGFVLLLFAINGRRILSFSFGNISADSKVNEQKAKDLYTETKNNVEPLPVDSEEGVSPQATQAPAATVQEAGEDIAIYALKDVPASVIRDALHNWPNEESPPDNLADFEFASRVKGQGNHPWTLKFQGKRPVVVSYGGHAKSNATVKNEEEG